MHRFDYSFLDNGMLPAGLINITADIYSLRAMSLNRESQFSTVYSELAAVAKIQSIKSSKAKQIRKVGTGRITKYIRN